ncbi:MAG: hypothetical protein RIA09_10150 [Hoeflea sp.]|uniref:hypothetical protein n=1 Tax=Hoeflea sp. TaxID=1940281 RepID=UPI0032ED939A
MLEEGCSVISLNCLDYSQNSEQYRNKYLEVRPHFGVLVDPRFAANNPKARMTGVFYAIAFELKIKAWFPAHLDCTPVQLSSARPRRKEFAMTHDPDAQPAILDCEEYRRYIAPLGLSRKQEDDLLHDLWAITETLVDQCFTSPTYPQQFAIAAHAFRALDDAVALKSQEQHENEATRHKEEL